MPVQSTNSDDYQDVPCAVSAMAKPYADGQRTPLHQHPRGQLLYATRGVLRADTGEASWLLPQGMALFIPAATVHGTQAVGAVHMLSLYIRAEEASLLGERCRLFTVTALLRELIASAAEPVSGEDGASRGELIARLILLELVRAGASACLPMPRDARLLKICEALLQDPGAGASLEDWAALAGASARTLARRFRSETGLNFVAWRQQVRIAEAVRRLGQGRPVKRIAMELGYGSASAFIAMFRAATGRPPLEYTLHGAGVEHQFHSERSHHAAGDPIDPALVA